MKKLKVQYRRQTRYTDLQFLKGFVDDESPHHHTHYTNMRCGNFKKPQSAMERSYHSLHKVERKDWEYPVKLKPRRNVANCPNAWDDIRSGVYDRGGSWKHNSKRKHQYHRIVNIT